MIMGVYVKGIVSRDFEVCFLIPLDSSDIATPGSVFKKMSIVNAVNDFSKTKTL
jgi:hypothetical protein